VEITDTGSGMDSAVLEHIFEPFFTTKQRGEGTGLGMSMAFGVIGQAGGDIEFDSELGVGTTCRIFLPLSDQVAPIESASHDVSVQGRGETILVVEDVVAIREMIEEMLSANGYNVRVTASSPEAIALLETNEGMTDLLLTDVIMPEKSGREVADTFKSVRPDGPVLFISGYANPLALSDLTYEYTLLRKPFSENDLLVAVRNSLERVR
jgi:CheY-like chemotaxis protein